MLRDEGQCIDWIHLAQDKVHGCLLVNTVIMSVVLQKKGKVLNS